MLARSEASEATIPVQVSAANIKVSLPVDRGDSPDFIRSGSRAFRPDFQFFQKTRGMDLGSRPLAGRASRMTPPTGGGTSGSAGRKHSRRRMLPADGGLLKGFEGAALVVLPFDQTVGDCSSMAPAA